MNFEVWIPALSVSRKLSASEDHYRVLTPEEWNS
jgi:hypothetical protein